MLRDKKKSVESRSVGYLHLKCNECSTVDLFNTSTHKYLFITCQTYTLTKSVPEVPILCNHSYENVAIQWLD